MAGIKEGEYVTFRSWDAFFDGAITPSGRRYLLDRMHQLVEFEGLILIEVKRVSKQRWQVIEVCTEDNNYMIEDEGVFLKAEFYDTKSLLNAVPVKWYNALLGWQLENRVKSEQNI